MWGVAEQGKEALEDDGPWVDAVPAEVTAIVPANGNRANPSPISFRLFEHSHGIVFFFHLVYWEAGPLSGGVVITVLGANFVDDAEQLVRVMGEQDKTFSDSGISFLSKILKHLPPERLKSLTKNARKLAQLCETECATRYISSGH